MNQVFVRNEVLARTSFDPGKSYASGSVRRVLQREGAVLKMAQACWAGKDRAGTTFVVLLHSPPKKRSHQSIEGLCPLNGLLASIEAVGG